MSDSQPASANRAVFLSYASQDAGAAKRICETLRNSGVEVWFDADGGLEHGDEWDAKIRRQIKECVLFIPVISANTQARHEGYFRIEWDLAAERARGIASGVPFILPVVIDDTREPEALVPDRFRAVQWTRLRGGEVPAAERARYLKLWSHRTGLLRQQELEPGRPRPGERDEGAASPVKSEAGRPLRGRLGLIVGATAAIVLIGALAWKFLPHDKVSAPSPETARRSAPPITEKSAAPLSEARQLLAKTGILMDALDNSRDDLKLAEELIAQAKSKDPMDAEVWATEAQLHGRYITRGWDVSDTRREAARAAAQRAIRLDPHSFEARLAQAGLLADTGRDGTEKERQVRELRAERPADKRVLRMLAAVIDRLGRMDEAAAIADESAALPGGDPVALYSKSLGFWFAGRTVEAETAIQASLAQQPFTGALMIAAWYRIALHGDLDGARSFIARIEPAQLIEDRAAFFAFSVEFLARRPDAAIARLQAVPRDWLNDFWHRGPKGQLVGDALELGGRHDAAVLEWTAALKLVDQRLAASPSNPSLIYNRIRLLFCLGQREEAERQLSLFLQMMGAVDIGSANAIAKCHALLGHKAEAIKTIATGLKHPSHAVAFPSGLLRLDPIYDPLRDEPEFAKLVAEAEALERAAGAAAPKSDLTATAPAKVDDKSVAVLAFANLSDDKGNEYFSDGISEELINALGKVPGLKVPARTSSFYFKGKSVPVPEIAKQLGVAYVIEGSVQRAGDKVKISARLSNAADGFQMWTDSFLRDAKDVFAVEEEIAGIIAKSLSLKLGVSSAVAMASVKPEAFELYVQGRSAWELRTAAGYDRAETLFTQAIGLESNFARAYVGRGDAWAYQAQIAGKIGMWDQRNSELFSGPRTEIERALSLEPDLAEAHASLGNLLGFMWDRTGAKRELKRAIELNPNFAYAHNWLGIVLWMEGEVTEARAELLRAAELDPLAMVHTTAYAGLLNESGAPREALVYADRAYALYPDSERVLSGRAVALGDLGRQAEAKPLALRLAGLGYSAFTMRAIVHAGLKDEIVRASDRLEELRPDVRVQVLAALGRWDELLTLWAKHPMTTLSTWCLYDPLLDPVRKDPRFLRPLEEVGLLAAHQRAQAWRAAHPSEKPVVK